MMRIITLIAVCTCVLATGRAQEPAGNLAEEIRELRKAVEQQSREISALRTELGKLAGTFDSRPAPAAEPAAAAPSPAPAREEKDKEEFAAGNAPKGEPGQPRHVIVKGETLTSVAKHYNVPLAELMKANKGLDERKLQIGQSILLPASAAPKATDSKTNP